MWNNGSLYPVKGMFVDESVCPVVPKGSTGLATPCHVSTLIILGWLSLVAAGTNTAHLDKFANRKVLPGVLIRRTAQTSQHLALI